MQQCKWCTPHLFKNVALSITLIIVYFCASALLVTLATIKVSQHQEKQQQNILFPV